MRREEVVCWDLNTQHVGGGGSLGGLAAPGYKGGFFRERSRKPRGCVVKPRKSAARRKE